MRAAAALMRHAARVQRRTPVAARRWRPQPTSVRRTALRCLSSKNDADDDDGGPVAVTIETVQRPVDARETLDAANVFASLMREIYAGTTFDASLDLRGGAFGGRLPCTRW